MCHNLVTRSEGLGRKESQVLARVIIHANGKKRQSRIMVHLVTCAYLIPFMFHLLLLNASFVFGPCCPKLKLNGPEWL